MRRIHALGAALIAIAAAAPAAAEPGDAGRIVIRSPQTPGAADPGRIVIRSPADPSTVARGRFAGAFEQPLPDMPEAAAPRRPAPKVPKRRDRPAPAPVAGAFELEDIAPSVWRAFGRANVRAAPGTSSAIVGKLDRDEAVTVLGRVSGSDWHAVDLDGKLAFIHASVARPTGEPAPGAVAEAGTPGDGEREAGAPGEASSGDESSDDASSGEVAARQGAGAGKTGASCPIDLRD